MKIRFSEILAKNRRKIGMTQDELVDRVKHETGERIDRTYMSKLESEKSNPNFSTIKNLCEGLGMSLAEFFSGQEVEKEPAMLLITPKEIRKDFDEFRIKADMVMIRVFKDISVFSLDRDIQNEYAPKYTFIDKHMIYRESFFKKLKDGYEHFYKKIVGLQIDYNLELSDFKGRKGSILIISWISEPSSLFIGASLCIVDTGDGKGPTLQRVTRHKGYIAFYDPKKDPLYHPATYWFKMDEFDKNIIRGWVEGIISRYYYK